MGHLLIISEYTQYLNFSTVSLILWTLRLLDHAPQTSFCFLYPFESIKYSFFFFQIYLFIYFWLCWVLVSVRGLFSSCGKRGPLFIAVRGPLTIVASLVAEHRLQTHRLSSCGSRAWMLRGMWDLPRPGLEPVSPALAGGLSTTVPPGKPLSNILALDTAYACS